jgi:aminoglycoside phosphotransferase (APT) family kinase protein
VWVHGDLLPGNLLLTGGRLSGVIDFGTLSVGDPACELQPAWHLFTGADRARYLDAVTADEAMVRRGRGWVLAQTVMALPYYRHTNPGIVRQSEHALAELLADGPCTR